MSTATSSKEGNELRLTRCEYWLNSLTTSPGVSSLEFLPRFSKSSLSTTHLDVSLSRRFVCFNFIAKKLSLTVWNSVLAAEPCDAGLLIDALLQIHSGGTDAILEKLSMNDFSYNFPIQYIKLSNSPSNARPQN